MRPTGCVSPHLSAHIVANVLHSTVASSTVCICAGKAVCWSVSRVGVELSNPEWSYDSSYTHRFPLQSSDI